MVPEILSQKTFGSKDFRSRKSGPKEVCLKEVVWKYVEKKNFESKKYLGLKKFGPKKCGLQRLRPPKVVSKYLVKIGSVTVEILLIWTNVPRTYVALSNVTITVGIC